jgi:hypothetical protein
MASWGVAQAKAKFSTVLDKAKSGGRVPVPEDGKTSGQRLWESLLCPPEDGVDVEFPRLDWKPRKVDS